jgi:hypothetical protein
MKAGFSANYNVRIRACEWDEPPERAPLYTGMYTFDLNQVVSVLFVPDLTDVGPPWSPAGLPEDPAEVRTPQQARLLELLGASYAVTPNQALAGTEERFTWPFEWPYADDPIPRCTVFYVTLEEFDRYAADLDHLSELAGNIHSGVRRAQVLEHDVVRFMERRILDSSWLTPMDARAVGRQTAPPTG